MRLEHVLRARAHSREGCSCFARRWNTMDTASMASQPAWKGGILALAKARTAAPPLVKARKG
eukprot:7390137-Pyramimonas_sp.AAC.1